MGKDERSPAGANKRLHALEGASGQVLPKQIKWRWVEGHLGKKGKKSNWWAKMNQLVDKNTKALLTRTIDNSLWKYQSPKLWYEKWAFELKGLKITNIDQQARLTALASSQIINYSNCTKPSQSGIIL